MATALIVIPIALSAAGELDVSAQPVLMASTVAAAASFLTPVATPANLMVMGPGGYRFGDYWKLGLPLLVLFGVVAVAPRPGLLVVLMDDAATSTSERRSSRPARCPPRRAGRRPWWPRRTSAIARERRGRRRSDVYPALARCARDLFGICVAGADGALYAAGDAEVAFSIMSVVEAVRVRAGLPGARRRSEARERLGVNATGLPFNSLDGDRAERATGARTRWSTPGAIATDEPRARARRRATRWQFIHDGLSRFAGRALVARRGGLRARPSATNHRNRAIARLLQSLRPARLRPGRGGRPLHPAVLAERHAPATWP